MGSVFGSDGKRLSVDGKCFDADGKCFGPNGKCFGAERKRLALMRSCLGCDGKRAAAQGVSRSLKGEVLAPDALLCEIRRVTRFARLGKLC